MPSKTASLMTDAFHQVTIAGDDKGLVIDQRVAKPRIQDSLGKRHADRVRDPLAERSGRRLDARGMAVFGMAGAGTAQLAEALDVVERDAAVTGEIKERVEQHPAVSGG